MKNIAIVFTGLDIDTTSEITQAIRDCLRDFNANGFFFSCERRYETSYLHDIGEYNIFTLPDFSRFDGAIVISSTINSKEILDDIWQRIDLAGIPSVCIEDYHEIALNIGIDNKAGMKELVSHFVVEHGYRRIAFVCGPASNAEAKDRFEAYKEVLEENGIEYDPRLIYQGDFLMSAGISAADYFLSLKGERPDAIIGANDAMITGVKYRFDQLGIKVPDEIALGGFDDERSSSEMQPGLTTVGREQYRTGYSACKKLIDNPKPTDRGKHLFLKTRLVVRESCGCKSCEPFDIDAFRRENFNDACNFEQTLISMREMATKLTVIDSLSSFREVLKRYIINTKCKYFAIMLCEEWEGYQHEDDVYDFNSLKEEYLNSGYGRKCHQIIGYDNGEFTNDEDIDLNDILAKFRDNDDGGHYFTVFPLHYQDRCFGYGFIGDTEFPFINPFIYTWTMYLGNALQTVRQQHLQRDLISKLNAMYIYDNLTGLYNRSGLRKFGSAIWRECISKKKEALVVFMDSDGLKYVNDTFGHEHGDRLLVIIAGILNEVRNHGEIAVRYGGDEFLILSPNGSEEYARSIKRQIIDKMRAFSVNHDLPYDVSVSIGCYLTKPTSMDELECAIEEADKLMYEDKRTKKERKNGK